MKIFLWIIGTTVILVLIPASIIFVNFAFRPQLEQLKVRFSPEYIALMDQLAVSEFNNSAAPSAQETPNTGDIDGGQEMLLYEDGSIKEGTRVFDDDPAKTVIVALNKSRSESCVFIKNEVFQYTEGRKGEKIGSFATPGFDYIGYVLPVNKHYMLVNGAMEDSAYPSERELWQVEYTSLNKTQLSNKPYYVFSRPPKVFVFEDDTEQLAVYYTGSFDYAFGGDSSRPEFSVLRIYNAQYPAGRDMIKFGFKAGTVLDVKKVDDVYIVTTDPSLPSMANKPRVAARLWKIALH